MLCAGALLKELGLCRTSSWSALPCSIAEQAKDFAASPNREGFQVIPPGMTANRGGSQAAAAKIGIEFMRIAAPLDVRRAESDAEGNRVLRYSSIRIRRFVHEPRND